MFWIKNKKNKAEKEEKTQQEPSWEEIKKKAENIEFIFKIGKKQFHIKTPVIQKICLGIVIFTFGIMFNNLFKFFFPTQEAKSKTEESYIDENKITDKFMHEFIKKETVEAEEKRMNQVKKRAAMDSLIDNQIFTKENIERVEKMYPDSLCGC